ncbi:MAG: ATP-binding protein [Pseudomonadota bacterium]
MHPTGVRPKWRPSLATVIGALCVSLVTLPVLAVLTVRLVDGQLVRETEASLQTQASLLAAVFAEAMGDAPNIGLPLDAEIAARQTDRFDPAQPLLSGSVDLLAPLPLDAVETAAGPVDPPPPYDLVAKRLSALTGKAKRRTLTGYVATDTTGRIIATSGTLSGDLSQVPEIAMALSGRDAASLRKRGDGAGRHPLTAISRNTAYRVFVAQPVIAGDRIVGAVMLSRTPTDRGRFLYRERATILRVGLLMGLGALAAGWLLWRLITRPIRTIARHSRAVADQTRPLPEPPQHYGVREVAQLGDSVLSMARTLDDRAGQIEAYTAHVTHELKSPTTAILGAAELLADEATTPERRDRLVASIRAQGQRMNTLLDRLRSLTRARLAERDRTVTLAAAATALGSDYPRLAIETEAAPDATLPISAEQAAIALGHLAANARQHGAGRLRLIHDAATGSLDIQDDGRGIDPADAERVLEPFFTTRRDAGGTGMGLAIVAAIAETSGGQLTMVPSERGARFRLAWPPSTPQG